MKKSDIMLLTKYHSFVIMKMKIKQLGGETDGKEEKGTT